MAAYLLVELTLKNPDNMDEYRSKVSDTIVAHGGKYLIRAGEVKIVEGCIGQHPTKVVVEFPNMEALENWYKSPEYQAILGNRLENSEGNALFVEGV